MTCFEPAFRFQLACILAQSIALINYAAVNLHKQLDARAILAAFTCLHYCSLDRGRGSSQVAGSYTAQKMSNAIVLAANLSPLEVLVAAVTAPYRTRQACIELSCLVLPWLPPRKASRRTETFGKDAPPFLVTVLLSHASQEAAIAVLAILGARLQSSA